MESNLLGIEIGGTKIQLLVGNAAGEIIERFRFHVGAEKEAARIRGWIERTVREEIMPRYRLQAVGIGFGGPIESEAGRVIDSFQVAGWTDFPIVDWLKKIVNVPVFLENDANLAAYAEALQGAGRSMPRVFYFTLGSGVGGGWIVNGDIYHGRQFGEAEIGHLKLDKSGRSVESACSGWAVDREIRAAIEQDPACQLAVYAVGCEGKEAQALLPALKAGCPVARRVLNRLADDLAFAGSHVVQLLNPDALIYGGGLSLIGEPLREAIESALQQYIMEPFRPGPSISLATLGEDVVGVGALVLAHSAQKEKKLLKLNYK